MSKFVRNAEPSENAPEVTPATQSYISGYGAYAPMTAGGVRLDYGLYR